MLWKPVSIAIPSMCEQAQNFDGGFVAGVNGVTKRKIKQCKSGERG